MEQTKTTELNHYQKAVVENAKWVDAVLLSGVALGGILIIAKTIGADEFDLHDLEISVDNAWIIFSIITSAHFYTSWLLNREILRLWETHSDEKCMAVFNEVRATGGIFVRGLSPRTNRIKSTFGIQIYEMRLDDPSTWAAHIFAVLLIAAIVPFDLSNPSYFFLILLVAIIITIINWIIGSLWIVPLSELAISHDESKILSKKLEISKSSAACSMVNPAK